MFERYTESARQALSFAKEEAGRAGSSYIEAEHLLLGIMRSCEPELSAFLKLKELEAALRSELAATAQPVITPVPADIPLANACKRILAYAMEEGYRLDSPVIAPGHLLLGILRESESKAASFLLAHNIDLPKTREEMARPSRSGDVAPSGRPRSGLASAAKRLSWIGTAVHYSLLILLCIAVAKSTISGRHLLVTGAIWSVAVLAWSILGTSFGYFFRDRNRALSMALTYGLIWLYQLLAVGWLIPLAVGIYIVTRR